MNKRILLIDGHNYLFRGYYGVPIQAKRRDGTTINAVYGFFSLLRLTLNVLKPDYLLIMFDSETSIDTKKYLKPEYKSNRVSTNNSVYLQLPLIRSCLNLLNIKWFDHQNHEADDLIGAYSELMKSKSLDVYIGSNDNDFIQLIDASTSLARGHHGTISVFNNRTVIERFGIEPYQYIDYLAMVGDKSDNIEGIRGIGKKTAVQLLKKHRDIDNIYQNFDLLSGTIKRLIINKQEFLNTQKSFLAIKRMVNGLKFLDKEQLRIKKQLIPEKMGKFIDLNWDRIKA